MKPLFKCELHYFHSHHLNQIYDGFVKLSKKGIIELSIKRSEGKKTTPILKVIINDKHTVIYDTLDGFNWIKGSIEENLTYFQNNINADFYFKRSFNDKVIKYSPKDCKVFPLGLNYSYIPEGNSTLKLKHRIKNTLKKSLKLKESLFYSGDFEFYPLPNKENKILFLARLWNPEDAPTDHLKEGIEQININRVNCIKACRKEFPNKFIGGLQRDSFSLGYSKDLVMPISMTKRYNFIKTIKKSNICIATTGLHDSIGWKFGEYVAASRGIISEPLVYELPGNFAINKNYLEFSDKNGLINNIEILLKDREKLSEIMKNNFQYYNNYLRSDILVLNTLIIASENF